LIRALASEFKLEYAGECKAFYSPAARKAPGEDYGLPSKLAVV
jgi:hypothetical protein